MNILKPILLGVVLLSSTFAFAKINVEYEQSSKTANNYCLKNKDCVDVVSMELDALYYQGLNEPRSTTIGTLINRKEKYFIDYCRHTPQKSKETCEDYKNQLMLKYITGLLDR